MKDMPSSENNAKKTMRELRRELDRHNHLYYDLNKPEISDIEYDRLF